MRSFSLCAGLVSLACILVACGATTVAGVAAANPATTSGTTVIITTDHTRYAPTDVIGVTITNTLATPIWAFNHQASCTVLSLELQTTSGWQDIASPNARIAGCPLGAATMAVRIVPGATLTGRVMAGYLRQGDAAFAPGAYRLVLRYYANQPTIPAATTPILITSAIVTVDLHQTAQPTPTLPPAGTAVTGSGTVLPAGTSQP